MFRTLRITSSGFAPVLLALAVTTTVAVAKVPPTDGSLPIYSGATMPGVPANWWSSGAYRQMPILELFTQDDEATVDAWYRSRLKGFMRRTLTSHGHRSAGYEGRGGRVKIVSTAGDMADTLAKYGKTVIFIDPDAK